VTKLSLLTPTVLRRISAVELARTLSTRERVSRASALANAAGGRCLRSNYFTIETRYKCRRYLGCMEYWYDMGRNRRLL
jgi:hypothetical protein